MHSNGFSKLLKASFIVGVMAGITAVPSMADAALLGTYTPPIQSSGSGGSGDNDLNDLDHHLMYAWRIKDTALAGMKVTSATLVFEKMYNWDNNDNRLFVDLLDTAKTAGGSVKGWGEGSDCRTGTGTANCGVTYFTDDPDAGNTAVKIRDDFKNMGDDNPTGGADPFKSQAGWLVAAGTGLTQMTAKEFLGPGQKYEGAKNLDGEKDVTGWTYTSSVSGGTTYYTYTYTFQTADLNALNAYLDSGSLNDFALAFDPDCHFYNTGITLSLSGVKNPPQTVPEPATLMLFGTGLAYVGRRYRRNKR